MNIVFRHDTIQMPVEKELSQDKRFKKSPVSPETLRDLIAGDHEAFERVFLLYFEKIKYFIFTLLKSSHTAEELTQDIFANLWQHRDKIDLSRNFNAYIYTIARNTVYNYAKHKLVRDRYTNSFWSSDSVPDAEELLIAREMDLLVSIAISRMPKQRRMVYEMSRKQGMCQEEIAAKLGISRNAVEKQLRYALNDIRHVFTILITLLYTI